MSDRVTGEWRVDEVLRRYPTTGPIFLQGGEMLDAGPGQIYPSYPALTVAEHAARSGVRVEALVRKLNAEAEATAFATRRPASFLDSGPEAR